MHKILDFFVKHWVRFLISLVIGLIIGVVYLLISKGWTLVIAYCNATFIAGFVLFAISVLVVLNLFGAFDIFSFFFMRKKVESGAKENLYDYSTRKKEERNKFKLVFMPYLVVATLFLIVSLILFFLI